MPASKGSLAVIDGERVERELRWVYTGTEKALH